MPLERLFQYEHAILVAAGHECRRDSAELDQSIEAQLEEIEKWSRSISILDD